MWVVTEHGFFTFVTDRKDPEYLWLRARVREDLEGNFPGITVEQHPGADYLWRAKVKRTDVAERIAQMVMDGRITSHFKDEALRKAPKTKFGSRHNAYYGFWTAMAALQDYAPYSKSPRGVAPAKPWTPARRDTRPGAGQTVMPYSYGGSSVYARDFDWDSKYSGGTIAKDPAPSFSSKTGADPLSSATDDEFEEIWAGMTEEERANFLDEQEDELRRREEMDSEHAGFLARMDSERPDFVEFRTDAYPAPRNRPGSRKQRRKGRKNRHNQDGLSDRQIAAQDRQTYLANKDARRNGKG
ncbi:hypothetical protein [Longimicrobium sp.]|jgi:hypothetical protein|uniref:hypothetical protein n=1 Tax=Longimicrobium sp. TaxID=2029185 RepID=UPI002EDB8DFE